MNQERRGGPGRALLLLIPAALIIAGARHRRSMWESGFGPSGAEGRGHHHPRRFGRGEWTPEQRAAFRLPPKIEWMLDDWHTRAHQAADAAGSTTV
jgi:hypothetical protein